MIGLFAAILISGISQQNLRYQSDNAYFSEAPGYVLCLETCPGPTPMKPAPPHNIAQIQEKVTTVNIRPLPPLPTQSPTPIKEAHNETVYFKLNSSRLNEAAKTVLDVIDRQSVKDITGFTCDLGPKAYNNKLARQRAEAVAAYLRVAEPQVSITGNGKCCYADQEHRAKNRRVEILIEKTITKKE